jgi:hypothetical protein
MLTSRWTGLFAGCAVLLFAVNAQAVPVHYIFSGTGIGALNGTAFNGSFAVTETGDTSGITGNSGEYYDAATTATFVTDSLAATLTGSLNEVIENTAAPGFIGFGQLPGFRPGSGDEFGV